jgi:uncharacterized membrane protein
MTSPRSTSSSCRKVALSAAAVIVAVLAIGAMRASADTPPAAFGNTVHGFLAEGGAIRTIDRPDAATIPLTPDGQTGTSTLGINDRGQILGVYERRDGVVRHFIRNRKGRFAFIDDPPGTSAHRLSYEAPDINNRGEIVGFYNDDQGSTTTGFLRSRNGRFKDVNVPGSLATGPLRVNDRQQVVGIYVDAESVHGFLWDDGDFETIDVPGATATLVLGINNRGQMVGSYVDTDGAYHGFLRNTEGAITALPEAPGADPTMGGTQPVSINERGQIVGLAYDARGGGRGFLYTRGVFNSIEAPGAATYTRALDINNHGQIVGDYDTEPSGV